MGCQNATSSGARRGEQPGVRVVACWHGPVHACSVRGKPNRDRVLLSNLVRAEIRSAGQRHNHQPVGVEHPAVRVADVDPEGGLPVRPRRDQPVGAPPVRAPLSLHGTAALN
jgi:hypothetical protein